MKLSTESLSTLRQNSDVCPGNVYPAKGGRKSPGTDFWLVVAVSSTAAHCIGFSSEGAPVSTASYLQGALRERPVIGRVDISAVQLGLVNGGVSDGGDTK